MLASGPRRGAEQPTLAASLSNSIARGTLQIGSEACEAICVWSRTSESSVVQ